MRTIELTSYKVDSRFLFSTDKVQKILGIKHPWTMRKYLKTLGIDRGDYVGWEIIKKMLALKLFLAASHGYHSHDMFKVLAANEQEIYVLERLGIDLEQQLNKLRSNYGS